MCGGEHGCHQDKQHQVGGDGEEHGNVATGDVEMEKVLEVVMWWRGWLPPRALSGGWELR